LKDLSEGTQILNYQSLLADKKYMKRFIFVFLIIPAFCFAQNKKVMSHFWDIPWGTSMERAEAIFTERGLSTFKEDKCLITLAKYEGEEAVIMLLFNRANRLYCGNVVYSSSGTTAIPKYDNYRKVLFRRYGMPDTAVEYFADPYEKGDGREIEAINSENAFYFTEWQFTDNCLASISILQNLDICLTFKNPAYGDSGIGSR
jgi:hypothetical protein